MKDLVRRTRVRVSLTLSFAYTAFFFGLDGDDLWITVLLDDAYVPIPL